MQFLEQVPLAPYTTFQIGGPARWFAEAASEDDIAAGVAFAGDRKLPLFVLGGGSNLPVSPVSSSTSRCAASSPARNSTARLSRLPPGKTGMGSSPTPSPRTLRGSN